MTRIWTRIKRFLRIGGDGEPALVRNVPPRPALVPLTVEAGWIADLRGITLGNVGVTRRGAGRDRP